MTKTMLAAALCAWAGLAGNAYAIAATAHAEARAVQFTLIDLNPDDGIAPLLTFGDFTVGGYTYLRDNGNFLLQDPVLTYGSAGISSAYGSAQASAAPDLFSSTATMTDIRPRNEFQAGSGISRDFTLSPYTAVIWNTAGVLSVQRPDGLAGNKAGVTLSAYFTDLQNGHQEYQTLSEEYSTDLGSSPFDLSLRVASDAQALTGRISLQTQVNAAIFAQPVPEPETYGMLAAGLLVIGARLRRRRVAGASTERNNQSEQQS